MNWLLCSTIITHMHTPFLDILRLSPSLYPGVSSPNPVSEGSLSVAFERTQPIPPHTSVRACVQVSCDVTLAMKRFSVFKVSPRPISTCALTQFSLAELASVFSLLWPSLPWLSWLLSSWFLKLQFQEANSPFCSNVSCFQGISASDPRLSPSDNISRRQGW